VSDEQKVEIGGHHKAVKMGLGDAIQRLMKVESLYANAVAEVPEQMLEERDLIVAALNDQFELNLGFDCNDDDVPDTVAIFQQTAQTSCCRILPTEIQRQVRKGSSGSRRTPAAAQKKSPQDDNGPPVRQHRGLAKTTSPRVSQPAPAVDPPAPPPHAAEPPPSRAAAADSEPGGTVVRIFRGLKKVTPEPSPA